MSCGALSCPSRTTKGGVKNPELSFHRFPKCPQIRKQWIKAVRRGNWEPTKNSRLCSKHFEKSCYIDGLSRRQLKTYAVPTIFKGYTKSYRLSKKTAACPESEGSQNNIHSQQPALDSPASGSATSSCDESDNEMQTDALPESGTGGEKNSGLSCDSCQLMIQAFRYTCVQCPDFTMCQKCEARGVHADHYVLRVPGSRPYVEIKAILDIIRQGLFPDIDMIKVEENSIKTEIKEELVEDDPLEYQQPEYDDIVPQQSTTLSDEKTLQINQTCSTMDQVPQMQVNLQGFNSNLNQIPLTVKKEVDPTRGTVYIEKLQEPSRATSARDSVGSTNITGVNTVLANIAPKEVVPRKGTVYIGQLQQANQVTSVGDSGTASLAVSSSVLKNIAPKNMIPTQGTFYIGELQQATHMTNVKDSASGVGNVGVGLKQTSPTMGTYYIKQLQPARLVSNVQDSSIYTSGVSRTLADSVQIHKKVILPNLVSMAKQTQKDMQLDPDTE